jgi:hypothetical protein
MIADTNILMRGHRGRIGNAVFHVPQGRNIYRNNNTRKSMSRRDEIFIGTIKPKCQSPVGTKY